MTPPADTPPSAPGLLRALLREPVRLGGAMFLALLVVSWGVRLGQLLLFVEGRELASLSWRAIGFLGEAVLVDLAVFGPLALLAGLVLARVRSSKGRMLAWGLALVVHLAAAAALLTTLPAYSVFRGPVTFTQLLLVGRLSDLFESVRGVISPGLILLAGGLLVASVALLPVLGALAAKLHTSVVLEARHRMPAYGLGATLALLALMAPPGSALGLEKNAIFELLSSAASWFVKGAGESPVGVADMEGAPHFPSAPMFDRLEPEPVERLMRTDVRFEKPQNVVLVVLESASVFQTGMWGGPKESTPNLARLADKAVFFDGYHAVAPVSMKSLFSIWCASYPYAHPVAETYANPTLDCGSISELFKARGYRTGLFHGGHFDYTHKDWFFRHRKLDVMRDAKSLESRRRYKVDGWGIDDRAVVDDALEWMGQAGDRPFFTSLVFLAPHHPYTTPDDVEKPFDETTPLGRYHNSTRHIDAQIGRVWDWLVEKGKADDTLIVIVGDHGEAFGEHPGHQVHGSFIYDEAVRTPMMLVHPRLFFGARTPRVGNHTDLVPTVLDVLNLPADPRHQGRSLLRGYEPKTIYFYTRWAKYQLGLRDGRFKYIHDKQHGTDQLFDVVADPGEKADLASGQREKVEAYRHRVNEFEAYFRELIPNYDRYVNGVSICPGQDECDLSTLEPVFAAGKWKRNRNVGNKPLRLLNRNYGTGFGVAAPSVLRFSLAGADFDTLEGIVGHDAGIFAGQLAEQVSAEIYLDDELVYSTGKMKASDEPRRFSIPLEGRRVLELIAHDVDGITYRDHVDWVDLRLVRKR